MPAGFWPARRAAISPPGRSPARGWSSCSSPSSAGSTPRSGRGGRGIPQAPIEWHELFANVASPPATLHAAGYDMRLETGPGAAVVARAPVPLRFIPCDRGARCLISPSFTSICCISSSYRPTSTSSTTCIQSGSRTRRWRSRMSFPGPANTCCTPTSPLPESAARSSACRWWCGPGRAIPIPTPGPAAPISGPTSALRPQPGLYKLWVQFKRQGRMGVVSYVVDVKSPVLPASVMRLLVDD